MPANELRAFSVPVCSIQASRIRAYHQHPIALQASFSNSGGCESPFGTTGVESGRPTLSASSGPSKCAGPRQHGHAVVHGIAIDGQAVDAEGLTQNPHGDVHRLPGERPVKRDSAQRNGHRIGEGLLARHLREGRAELLRRSSGITRRQPEKCRNSRVLLVPAGSKRAASLGSEPSSCMARMLSTSPPACTVAIPSPYRL